MFSFFITTNSSSSISSLLLHHLTPLLHFFVAAFSSCLQSIIQFFVASLLGWFGSDVHEYFGIYGHSLTSINFVDSWITSTQKIRYIIAGPSLIHLHKFVVFACCWWCRWIKIRIVNKAYDLFICKILYFCSSTQVYDWISL